MHSTTLRHGLKLVPLALALGLAISTPAKADPAGPACWVFNSTTGEWEPDAGADRTLGSEHGDANSTCHADASAYGKGNNASAAASTAIGANNIARGSGSTAVGGSNTASGSSSTAVGDRNVASGVQTSAIGHRNTAVAQNSAAVGTLNTAESGAAFGLFNTSSGTYANAFG